MVVAWLVLVAAASIALIVMPRRKLAAQSVRQLIIGGTEWTAQDAQREEALFLGGQSAFWLRPDRHEFDEPCWMIDAPYEARRREEPAPSKRPIKGIHVMWATTATTETYVVWHGITAGTSYPTASR